MKAAEAWTAHAHACASFYIVHRLSFIAYRLSFIVSTAFLLRPLNLLPACDIHVAR